MITALLIVSLVCGYFIVAGATGRMFYMQAVNRCHYSGHSACEHGLNYSLGVVWPASLLIFGGAALANWLSTDGRTKRREQELAAQRQAELAEARHQADLDEQRARSARALDAELAALGHANLTQQ